jgi:hypothetical protein
MTMERERLTNNTWRPTTGVVGGRWSEATQVGTLERAREAEGSLETVDPAPLQSILDRIGAI